jgi:hypothetical protein
MNTGNSEKGFAGELASGESLAMRFLIDYPEKGWRLISAKRVLAAQRGELLMSELANRTVRVAYADVALRDSRPVALYWLELAEWRVDAEGRVDQAALISRVINKLDQSAERLQKRSERDSVSVSKTDLDAICSALKFPPTN